MPSVPAIQELDGVFLLDTLHAGRSGTIGVYLLPLEDSSFALVETGPGSTVANVERAITQIGLQVTDLSHILVTHIHLDHAGGAGELARKSGAKVYVHHRGARHLADPSRLLGSAHRVYGERMQELWGDMEPVPEDRLHSLFDGDLLQLPGLAIEAFETPGHASHHVAFLLEDGTLFTGDAAGVRFPPSQLIRPALPPPETDLEAWEATIAKLKACVPERLLLTHFGEVREADAHLSLLPERNRKWADEALTGLRAGENGAELEERISRLQEAEFREAGLDESFAERYRATSDAAMTAMGLRRYWQTRHPEALEDR